MKHLLLLLMIAISTYADLKEFKTLLNNGGRLFGSDVLFQHIGTNDKYDSIVINNLDIAVIRPLTMEKLLVVTDEFVYYKIGKIDSAVNYCDSVGIKPKGHTLVWNDEVPDYVFNSSKEQVAMYLKDHIDYIMTRYKGKMHSYDVINEAFGPYGIYRHNIFYHHLDSFWIDSVFTWAHSFDNKAELYINDYFGSLNYAAETDKLRKMYALVSRLVANDIPITGVGIQMHLHYLDGINTEVLNTFLAAAKYLGLKVSFSEVDVKIQTPISDYKLNKQAEVYQDIIQSFALNSNCKSYIAWGVSDLVSWIPDRYPMYGYACFLDSNFVVKPCLTQSINKIYELLNNN